MATKVTVDGLSKIAEGKVRDLYEVDEKTLLFVASDRISAYDVIMANVGASIVLHKIFDTNTMAGCSKKGFTPHSPVRPLVQRPPKTRPRSQDSLRHPRPSTTSSESRRAQEQINASEEVPDLQN